MCLMSAVYYKMEKMGVREMPVDVEAESMGMGHKDYLYQSVKDRCGLSKWDETGLNYCCVT